MLDHLRVDIYGDHLPMKACGTATVRDPQLLVVNVFDPSVSKNGIEISRAPGCGQIHPILEQ